ncbi:MAG: Ni/Fe-hydrogenase, b-type cytochrome subunit [Saprospiraceae bacterium]|jgi:Ni/Fe-hydrogenase 1 B-type cytochrome subunit
MVKNLEFVKVYVWELPVRIFHWINALAILVLSVTGYIIAKPLAIQSSHEAWNSYWFGTVRAVHFASAYIFLTVMVLRLYWAFFAGNQFANWKEFIPFRKKALQNMGYVLKHDILLIPHKGEKFSQQQLSHISIGHNSLATAAYLFLFILALVMVFTGFGLYADMATWWLPKMFKWVVPAMGGDFMARSIHHVTMWLMWLIIAIHIYLVFFHDWLEARGETSSMFSGFKFVCKDRIRKG